MNRYNYNNGDDSSKDSISVTQISEHDLSWLLNSDCTTEQILKWEYAQAYDIPIEEVQRQLESFANSEQ